MISSWSHSRLAEFNKCNYRAFLLYEQRVAEPQRPLPPGKTEHANDRGTRIHTSCEEFIIGKSKTLCIEAVRHFEPQLTLLRVLHAAGQVSVEGEWAMDKEWNPVAWNGEWMDVTEWDMPATGLAKKLPDKGKVGDVLKIGRKFFAWVPPWLRLKLDACVFHSETHATVIDFKSGKKFGNEIKHGEQLQLYQLVTFLRYPKLERVDAELWYIDQNETTRVSFTRAQGLRFKSNFNRQGVALTTATTFPPRPNVFSCQYCEYGPWGTGHCKVGVRREKG